MTDLFTNNPQSIVSTTRIIYTPSTFARSSLLHLQEIGELHALQAHESRRSGLNSYLFFTVVSGSGKLVYNGREYRLSSGNCVFIDCNEPYSHTTDPANLWTLRWCHFNGSTMNSVYNKYCERGGRPVFKAASVVPTSTPANTFDDHSTANGREGDYNESINELLSSLMSIASSDDYMRDMLINQQLSSLLTLIMSESWHPENQEELPKKKSLLMDVKKYIDENYESKISLDEMAGHFYINKYYLSKSFKEQFGQSLSSYILSVRITKAKQLLRFSDKSVEQIGYECGLGAPHYFSQKFKDVEGVPPSKYREQW